MACCLLCRIELAARHSTRHNNEHNIVNAKILKVMKPIRGLKGAPALSTIKKRTYRIHVRGTNPSAKMHGVCVKLMIDNGQLVSVKDKDAKSDAPRYLLVENIPKESK